MKSLLPLILLLVLIGLSSCGDTGTDTKRAAKRPVSYVLLLDLSDRLLLPNQATDDIALIQMVFEQFQQRVVKQNLVINSHDKFRVVIAPQKGIGYDPASYMTRLYIDMDKIPMAQKRLKLEAFANSLRATLLSLYGEARLGRDRTDAYAGCDLWRYFNEQLATDMASTADNKLIVLTDGYFDFEQNAYIKQQRNRSTSTSFIPKLRGQTDWQAAMKNEDWGLVPVQPKFSSLAVAVAEISPKSQHLDESAILKAVWVKWLTEMNVNQPTCIIRNNQSKSKALLQQFIQL